ncbi:MAG: DUF2911 domain-containing protein [Terriglobales bacterium]
MRTLAICVLAISQMTLGGVSQQAASLGKLAEVVCTFNDGKQMKVEYSSATPKRGEDFHDRKLWEPGGSPMFLFTEPELTIAGSLIPEGAYSVYVIPEKRNWTLVINRNTAATGKYDGKQDLVRAPMEIAESEAPVAHLEVALAHLAPKQCNLRLYYEKIGAWAEFHEK